MIQTVAPSNMELPKPVLSWDSYPLLALLTVESPYSMAGSGTDWLEIPTIYIYKAYFSGLNFREYPHKIWPDILYSNVQYLHFRILKIPLK
jgi:hypothetical protein